MINIENGSIKVNERNYIITRNMTKDDFFASPLYDDIVFKQEFQNGYSNYILKKQQYVGEKYLYGIGLYFNPSNKLYSIHLNIVFEDDTGNWDNWSQDKELYRKKIHDNFLKKYCGEAPYNYTWGSLSSEYDERSGGSCICIVYNQN